MIELVSRWHLLWRQSPQIQWRRFWSKDKFKKMTKREFHFAEERILWRRTKIAHWWSRVGDLTYTSLELLLPFSSWKLHHSQSKTSGQQGIVLLYHHFGHLGHLLKPTLSHSTTASPKSMALTNWGSSFLSDLFDLNLCRVQCGILSHPCKSSDSQLWKAFYFVGYLLQSNRSFHHGRMLNRDDSAKVRILVLNNFV
jgi:hypothetical protein